jgi:hypothetical protein
MTVFMKLTRTVRRGGLLASIVVAMLGIGLFAAGPALADVSLGGGQNCDANAVVYCGATSASQLVAKYNTGDGHNAAASIQNIYNYFGITSPAVQNLATTAVAGTVTKAGNVYIGSQEVATGALTAGRENIAGSTSVTDGSTTFYTRSPGVSFVGSPLNAYVVMSGGTFQFAILSSCGNPIKATPVAPPPPLQTPTAQCTNLALTQATDNPRQVTATAAFSVQNGAALTGVTFTWGDGTTTPPAGTQASAMHTYQTDGTFTVQATITFTAGSITLAPSICQSPITASSITPVQAPPTAPPPAVTTVASTRPATLVNTGAGNVIGVFVVATAVGIVAYRRILRHYLG